MQSAAHVGSLVASAAMRGARVRVRGANVWCGHQGPVLRDPAPSGRPVDDISMLDLEPTVEHSPGDLTVTASCSVSLDTLQNVLGQHGQWLPYRPGGSGAATLGGLLAVHPPGSTRLGHGSLRDRVLGLSVIDGRGRCITSGGRVVKNVAGYDLHRLHVGGRGATGILVEATFKVVPREPWQATFQVDGVSPAMALDLAAGLTSSVLSPAAVTFTWDPTTAPRGFLRVAFATDQEARDRVTSDLDRRARALGLAPFAEVPGLTDGPGPVVDRPGAHLEVSGRFMGTMIESCSPGTSGWADLAAGSVVVTGGSQDRVEDWLVRGTPSGATAPVGASRPSAPVSPVGWGEGLGTLAAAHPCPLDATARRLTDHLLRSFDPEGVFAARGGCP